VQHSIPFGCIGFLKYTKALGIFDFAQPVFHQELHGSCPQQSGKYCQENGYPPRGIVVERGR